MSTGGKNLHIGTASSPLWHAEDTCNGSGRAKPGRGTDNASRTQHKIKLAVKNESRGGIQEQAVRRNPLRAAEQRIVKHAG
jgi:hypothetical protein